MKDEFAVGMHSVKGTEKPLSDQVAEQIRRYIIEQHLGIGAKLPNEFELCQQLNVGRGTIREAVKQLVSRNVLEVQRGRGTFVANNTGMIDDPFGFAYMENEKRLAQELFQIRLELEPWIAELAARQVTEEKLQELEKLQAEVETLICTGQNYLPADQQFHICVAACTDNRVLPMLVPIITYSVHLLGKLNEHKLIQETIDTHEEIVRAIRERNDQQARQAMEKHLMLNMRSVSFLSTEN